MMIWLGCGKKPNELEKKSTIATKEKESKQNFELKVKEQPFNPDNRINNGIKVGIRQDNITYKSRCISTMKTTIKVKTTETQEEAEVVNGKSDDTSTGTTEAISSSSQRKTKSVSANSEQFKHTPTSEAKILTDSDELTDNWSNAFHSGSTIDNLGVQSASFSLDIHSNNDDGVITRPQTISDSGSGTSGDFGNSYGSIQWGIKRGGGRYNLRSKKEKTQMNQNMNRLSIATFKI